MGVKLNPFTGKLDVVDSPSGDFSTVELNQGTQTSPSISFDGDPNTGIYSPGADQLAISTNGAGRLFVDSAGSVGIGYSTPGDFLDSGDQLVIGGSSNQGMTLYSSTSASTSIYFADGTTGADRNVGEIGYNHASDSLKFVTAGSERLRITSDGKLGLGTSSPQALLHISNGGAAGVEINPVAAFNGPYIQSYNRSGSAYTPLDFIASNFYWYNSGSPVMRLDTSGRLGIGTASPARALDVNDSADFAVPDGEGIRLGYRGETKTAYIGIDANDAYSVNQSWANSCWIGFESGAVDKNILYRANQNHIFYGINGVERVRIDSSGRFYVGGSQPGFTAGPGNALDKWVALQSQDATTTQGFWLLNQDATFRRRASFAIDPVNNTAGIYTQCSSGNKPAITFTQATFERARIDSDGRLLVGTSAARSNLRSGIYGSVGQIETAGTNAFAFIQNTTTDQPCRIVLAKQKSGSTGGNTSVANNDNIGSVEFLGNDGTNFIQAAAINALVDGTPGANDMPGRLVFSTTAATESSPTERMRIKNNGSTLFFSADNTVFSASAQAAGASYALFVGRHSATTTVNGTDCFYVLTNGNVQNTNNSYGAISDAKLKENIVDANSQWDDLKAIQVRNYNFKEGQTHTQLGVVAQEVELVSPGLVSESPDRDENGNDLGTVTKSVNYSVLYMKAVKALQEAMERIETLEAKVNALEGN
jgi:hypothetical protein